ncbi:hypothetical protein Q6350_07120 [Isoptericola sp. b515]|uniref:hypothetical protein n=1 Tax=Isoptericola sp. b515 TaxID=3064652 RepID=UPI002713045A|nr:hypothetical protein [Isoptericola sp. b515]MDO8148202.1 hypothetical protein [Isoptericola sp. b515]
MSTTPNDAWRDAGLETPDDTTSLVEEAGAPPAQPQHEAEVEDYHPGFPRPDLEGSANEADVVEQDIEVPSDDPDDLGGTASA